MDMNEETSNNHSTSHTNAQSIPSATVVSVPPSQGDYIQSILSDLAGSSSELPSAPTNESLWNFFLSTSSENIKQTDGNNVCCNSNLFSTADGGNVKNWFWEDTDISKEKVSELGKPLVIEPVPEKSVKYSSVKECTGSTNTESKQSEMLLNLDLSHITVNDSNGNSSSNNPVDLLLPQSLEQNQSEIGQVTSDFIDDFCATHTSIRSEGNLVSSRPSETSLSTRDSSCNASGSDNVTQTSSIVDVTDSKNSNELGDIDWQEWQKQASTVDSINSISNEQQVTKDKKNTSGDNSFGSSVITTKVTASESKPFAVGFSGNNNPFSISDYKFSSGQSFYPNASGFQTTGDGFDRVFSSVTVTGGNTQVTPHSVSIVNISTPLEHPSTYSTCKNFSTHTTNSNQYNVSGSTFRLGVTNTPAIGVKSQLHKAVGYRESSRNLNSVGVHFNDTLNKHHQKMFGHVLQAPPMYSSSHHFQGYNNSNVTAAEYHGIPGQVKSHDLTKNDHKHSFLGQVGVHPPEVSPCGSVGNQWFHSPQGTDKHIRNVFSDNQQQAKLGDAMRAQQSKLVNFNNSIAKPPDKSHSFRGDNFNFKTKQQQNVFRPPHGYFPSIGGQPQQRSQATVPMTTEHQQVEGLSRIKQEVEPFLGNSLEHDNKGGYLCDLCKCQQ